MKFFKVLRVASANKEARAFPGAGDYRMRGHTIFPSLYPTFKLPFSPQTKVFTIGSCFARNIEEALSPLNVLLPTQTLSIPSYESFGRTNAILNEYNPGTIAQRITWALDGVEAPLETLIERTDGFLDLTLPPGSSLVGLERALERRAQIHQVYSELLSSKLVIITLGFIEAFYDTQTCLYLNQMPPSYYANRELDRFEFRRIEFSECYDLLFDPLSRLSSMGVKILLTVSPVPLQTTFTSNDCVVANQYSKAVLRCCAERLCKYIPNMDYFPSYEIVTSGGLTSFSDDQIHVRDELVRDITGYMINNYSDS